MSEERSEDFQVKKNEKDKLNEDDGYGFKEKNERSKTYESDRLESNFSSDDDDVSIKLVLQNY